MFFWWWWKFISEKFVKNELSFWVAQRCHQSSNHMQVKNVLRDTKCGSNASKPVTNGHVKLRHFGCIVYTHTYFDNDWNVQYFGINKTTTICYTNMSGIDIFAGVIHWQHWYPYHHFIVVEIGLDASVVLWNRKKKRKIQC